MDYFITDYGVARQEGVECAVLEDSIMHKGHLVTAGSRMLEGFVSPIDATVVTRLEAAGVQILGKTNMDEFGVSGLFSQAQQCTVSSTSNLEPNLPSSESHAPMSDDLILSSEDLVSGSSCSCGAVSVVADGAAGFALCNDYTGLVGRQAAERGLYYIHPTYGTVSRYGLVPTVPSMDQIGIVCKATNEGRRVLSIISGHDPKDGAMLLDSDFGFQNSELGRGEFVIGVPTVAASEKAVLDFVKGFDIVDVELDYFDIYAQVMRILCCAELSGNLSRYDGIKFGYRTGSYGDLEELYTKSRTEAFGADVKLALIIGAMVLSQENYARRYDKAMRIRRLIKDSLDFSKYDAIAIPASASSPNATLALSALPRLCGLPAISVPTSNGGITLIADRVREDILFSILR